MVVGKTRHLFAPWFLRLAPLALASSVSVAAVTGCEATDAPAAVADDAASGGAPASGAGGTPASGAGGSSGEPADGAPLVYSDSDPACIPLRTPKELHIVVGGENAALKCDDSRIDVDACSGAADLIGFEYESDEIFFWVNFQPQFATAPRTEQTLREYFRWFWYQLEIQAPGGGEPFITSRIYVEDLNDTQIFSFTDDRLHVKLQTTVTELLRWVEPVDGCYDTDVGPLTCACKYPVSFPVTVDVDLAFPQ